MCVFYVLFQCNYECLIIIDVKSVELIKYVVNVMLVICISFMNELVNFVEVLGVDIEMVCQGIGFDLCIGYYFFYFGCGYGGFCFLKDVKVLIKMVQDDVDIIFKVLMVVEEVNDVQKYLLIKKFKVCFGDFKGKYFVFWGLFFKFNIDDMCEVLSCELIVDLFVVGVMVSVYDLVVMYEMQCIYGDEFCLIYVENLMGVFNKVDVLIIVIEWKEFCSLDFEVIKQMLKNLVIFDGCNFYDLKFVCGLGIEYFVIGC